MLVDRPKVVSTDQKLVRMLSLINLSQVRLKKGFIYPKIRSTDQKIELSGPDLEKVVNRPQAENSELYNVLKIAYFATINEQKCMY